MSIPVAKPSDARSAGSSHLRIQASVGRSSAVVAAGVLAGNLLSAAQALVVLFIVGPGQSTDVFLSVYAIYTPFALLGATLRRSLVPLIGAGGSDEEFRDRACDVVSRVVLYARSGTVLGLLAAPGAAYLITAGRPAHARLVAVLCLLTLTVAAYFQLYGGALSGALSAMSRYSISAALYVAGSLIAVAGSAALSAEIGILGAPLGVLGGASFFAMSHRVYLWRFRITARPRIRWLRERRQHRLGFRLIAAAALTAALQFNLAIALSAVGKTPGEATIYAYAYYIVGLITNLSAVPLSLVIMPSLIAEIQRRGFAALRDRLLLVVPQSVFVLVPVAMAFAAFGRPLLGVVFGHILSVAQLRHLYLLGLVLELMLVFTTVYTLAGSLLLALRRFRAAMYVALAAVLMQAAITYPVSRHGSLAVAGAHVAATAGAALVLLVVVFHRDTGAVVRGIGAKVAPALVLALLFVAVRLPFGLRMTSATPSPYLACAAILAAIVLYALASSLIWPQVATPFLRSLKRGG